MHRYRIWIQQLYRRGKFLEGAGLLPHAIPLFAGPSNRASEVRKRGKLDRVYAELLLGFARFALISEISNFGWSSHRGNAKTARLFPATMDIEHGGVSLLEMAAETVGVE